MFLWNIGWLSLDYTAFYTRRQNSSKTQMFDRFRQPKNIQHNTNDSTSLWYFWTYIKYCDHKRQDEVLAIIQINQIKMTYTYNSQKVTCKYKYYYIIQKYFTWISAIVNFHSVYLWVLPQTIKIENLQSVIPFHLYYVLILCFTVLQ
jgi:hypothetical protein